MKHSELVTVSQIWFISACSDFNHSYFNTHTSLNKKNDLFAGPYFKEKIPAYTKLRFPDFRWEKERNTSRLLGQESNARTLFKNMFKTNINLNLAALTMHLLLHTALQSSRGQSCSSTLFSQRVSEVSHDLGNLYTIITNRHFAWGPFTKYRHNSTWHMELYRAVISFFNNKMSRTPVDIFFTYCTEVVSQMCFVF